MLYSDKKPYWQRIDLTICSSQCTSNDNTPINVKLTDGREEAAHRDDNLYFPKECCQNPYPQGNVRPNITDFFPPREMICGHRHKQKFKHHYPGNSKIIQMPHPGAKAINQTPALCPTFPNPRPPRPHQLDIQRCITSVHNWEHCTP